MVSAAAVETCSRCGGTSFASFPAPSGRSRRCTKCGQAPVAASPSPQRPRWPRVVKVGIPAEILGTILEYDKAESESCSGHTYHLIRTPSGWHHTSTDCMGWLIRETCHHVKERTAMTMAVTTVLSPGALDIIDELDEIALFRGVGSAITPAWAYSFPMDGKTVTGLSAIGVEEASLELAKKGMALREIDVRVEYEDEREARFLACVGRYAVSETGGQTLLDSAIRGKRVSKYEQRANGSGEYFNKNWYEHGVTKAARNAKRALLPEAVVAYVLEQALASGKVAQGNPRAARVQAPAQRGALPQGNGRRDAPAGVDGSTGEMQSDTPTKPTPSQLNGISRLIDEIRSSWGENSDEWKAMNREVMELFTKEKVGNRSLLTYDEAAALLLYLRRKNGEPVDAPIEDEIPATAT